MAPLLSSSQFVQLLLRSCGSQSKAVNDSLMLGALQQIVLDGRENIFAALGAPVFVQNHDDQTEQGQGSVQTIMMNALPVFAYRKLLALLLYVSLPAAVESNSSTDDNQIRTLPQLIRKYYYNFGDYFCLQFCNYLLGESGAAPPSDGDLFFSKTSIEQREQNRSTQVFYRFFESGVSYASSDASRNVPSAASSQSLKRPREQVPELAATDAAYVQSEDAQPEAKKYKVEEQQVQIADEQPAAPVAVRSIPPELLYAIAQFSKYELAKLKPDDIKPQNIDFSPLMKILVFSLQKDILDLVLDELQLDKKLTDKSLSNLMERLLKALDDPHLPVTRNVVYHSVNLFAKYLFLQRILRLNKTSSQNLMTSLYNLAKKYPLSIVDYIYLPIIYSEFNAPKFELMNRIIKAIVDVETKEGAKEQAGSSAASGLRTLLDHATTGVSVRTPFYFLQKCVIENHSSIMWTEYFVKFLSYVVLCFDAYSAEDARATDEVDAILGYVLFSLSYHSYQLGSISIYPYLLKTMIDAFRCGEALRRNADLIKSICTKALSQDAALQILDQVKGRI